MSSPPITIPAINPDDYNLKSGQQNQLALPIDPHKHFKATINQFDKLAVGPHFWFMVDAVKGITIEAGGMIDITCNFSREEFIDRPPELLFKNTHPQDIGPMLTLTSYWMDYYANLPIERRPFVRPSFFIRILNARQTYYWALVQYAEPISDKNGVIVYGLTLVTDISLIKQEGTAQMSILDTYSGSSQLYTCSSSGNVDEEKNETPKLTPKEIEVLRLLAIGQSSKIIAANLGSAVKTVDNHRQSMLHKTQSKSTAELVNFAIKMGFI